MSRKLEKQVLQRLQEISSSNIFREILCDYGFEPLRRSCAFQGLEKMLEGIPRNLVCAEIGTHNAVSTVILSRKFKKVISFDTVIWPYRDTIAEKYGAGNIEFVVGDDSRKFLKTVRHDIAFLDGDHSNTPAEFNAANCGRVLFHEFWEECEPVWNLVNSLPVDKIRTGGVCFAYYENI